MSIYPHRRGGQLTGLYRVEVTHNGKRLRGQAGTLDDAKALEAQLIANLSSPASLTSPRKAEYPKATSVPKGPTLADAEKRAVGILWAGQASEHESFKKLKRILSIVGPQTLVDDFDTNSVDQIIRFLSDRQRSEATINRYLSCVSAFMSFCKRRGIRTLAVPEIEWRDEDEGRIRWLSDTEEDTLYNLLPKPYDTIVYLAIRTGLRASELLKLKPDQVEPGWVRLWKTKNGSIRSVPITDKLYELLAPLVTSGLPDYWQLRNEWDKARRAMGLDSDPTFVFHACRHSYATRAIQAGVNIRVLQKLMGHKSIQTTLRYAHVEDATMAKEARSAIQFHEDRRWAIAHKSTSKTRQDPKKSAIPFAGVPRLVTANPYTPVRFRLGPPGFSVTYVQRQLICPLLGGGRVRDEVDSRPSARDDVSLP